MKPVFIFLSFVLIVLLPFSVFSQCAGGVPALTTTYDTVLYGMGNNGYTVSFPKFDPSLGTLLSADIVSQVGVKYGFIANNTAASPQSLKVRISRQDDINSTALADPITATNQSSQINRIVAGGGSYSYGPAYMARTSTTSITNGDLVNFEGAGVVDFDYETEMTVTLTGSLAFDLSFTAIVDTTHFSVTYRYCTASLLNANLLYFSATPLKFLLSV